MANISKANDSREENTYLLLVGVQTRTATVEASVKVPQDGHQLMSGEGNDGIFTQWVLLAC